MRKSILRRGYAALVMTASAILIAVAFAFPATVYAAEEEYQLWIGSTQVTSDNAGNIFNETGADGNPTAWYEEDTKTLHLNGVHIGSDNYHTGGEDDNSRYSLMSDGAVYNLVITGENTFAARGTVNELGEGVGMYFQGMPTGTDFLITGDGSLRSEGYAEYSSLTGAESPPSWVADGYGMYFYGGRKVCIGESGKSGPTIYAYGSKSGFRAATDSGMSVYSGTVVGVVTNIESDRYGIDTGMKTAFLYGGLIAGYGCDPIGYFMPKNTEGGRDWDLYKSYDRVAGKAGWWVYGDPTGPRIALYELGIDPTAEDDTDTAIDVMGFTEDATVYSVDVEWGAMTFQYENTTWDATEHKTVAGAGWKVYDSTKDKALDATEDAINEVKVTNHSNAPVWATLSYASEEDYDPDTAGEFFFTTGTEDGDEDVLTAATADVPAYLALETADNNEGEAEGQGKETVGKAYFMPSGIKEEYKTADGIAKWSQLGTITVGILTEEP